nr:metal-dependent transcriptional regulator [Scrofimicrobium canadense]
MAEVASIDLIDTTEMYLKTVFEMEEDGVTPLRARIVERLGHSGPTVSQTVARMERDGLVWVRGDRRLELTPEGRKKAIEVMRKHRLAERLLVDVIGMEWTLAHEEACRWEHVMSDAVEEKLNSLLNSPTVDPYGNPIPGASDPVEGEMSLEEAARDGSNFTVARIGEPIQAERSLLEDLEERGIGVGTAVAVQHDADVYVVSVADNPELSIGLTSQLAPHFFVVN